MNLVIGLLVPFLGTSLGAACVFFMKNGLNRLVQKALLGFASGVMVAASVWSLLIPSIDMSEGMGKFAFLPAAIGFIFGILFLLLMDKIIPHLHMNEDKPEGLPSHLKKTTMLVLAVTLHNIPEGMAVGVVFAGLLSGNNGITQKAFWYGVASGVVEPIAAGITIILAGIITHMLPYLLAFAAGAMIYVVVEELLPEASEGEHSNINTIGFAAGFLIMMILDVALG